MMRRFGLDRREDFSGTSGTGLVAEGVCFTNGKVALNWLSHLGAVNVYDSMEVTHTVHGHDGRTKVEWFDYNDLPPSDLELQNAALRKYINDVHHAVEPLVGLLRQRTSDPLCERANEVSKALSPSPELMDIIRGAVRR